MGKRAKCNRKRNRIFRRNQVTKMDRPKTALVYQFLRKLKTQGDISVEEADWIRLLMKNVYEFEFKMEQEMYSPNAEGMTSSFARKLLYEEFPVAALQDWYKAVARQIEKGQSGNFIFSVPLSREMLFFNNSVFPALEALRKYGSQEDRMEAMFVNPQMYSLFPKHFQDLFTWERVDKYSNLYAIHGQHAGFFRRPLRDPKSGKVYTISQMIKELSLIPAMTNKGLSMVFSNKVRYLQRTIPCVDINTVDGSSLIFTNKEGISIAQKTLDISLEELVKNALEQDVINKKVAKELLRENTFIEGFIDEGFVKASLKYIDKKVKMKLEWENTKKTVEDESDWLEIIR